MFDFNAFLTDPYSIALAALMLLALVGLCIHYGLYYMRVGRYKDAHTNPNGALTKEKMPPVSVVMVAHNQAEWLKENLVYLLEQEYDDYEVVVVDHTSTDDTHFVLFTLQSVYKHLKVVTFREDVNLFKGKKYPLSIGIKSAKNDIVLLADPECIPRNFQWLKGMVRGYDDPAVQIVLGYCGVKSNKTLLGSLQRYDVLDYSAHYLGSVLAGHPSTGSGRNLSYRREFFFAQGSFIGHYDIAEGADDLFIYQNATRKNTAISIGNDARLTIEPLKTFGQWHDERKHRVATRGRHSLRSRLRGDRRAVLNILFYGAGVALVVLGALPWPIVALAAVIKWVWQIVCFAQLTKRFDGGKMHFVAPLLEIYFIIANTILILTPLHTQKRYK